jgi:hypothetical protein
MNFFKNNINKKIISFLTSNMEIQKISEVDFTYELKYLIKDWYIELLFHFKNDLTENELITYIRQILLLEKLLITDKNMIQEYKGTIDTIMDTVLRNEDVKKSIDYITKKLKNEPELKKEIKQTHKDRKIQRKKSINDYLVKPTEDNNDSKNLYKVKQKAIELNTDN